mgnify:CR=1 FL=1
MSEPWIYENPPPQPGSVKKILKNTILGLGIASMIYSSIIYLAVKDTIVNKRRTRYNK